MLTAVAPAARAPWLRIVIFLPLLLAQAAPCAPSWETVSFKQILADPDDPDLNYRYALAQIDAGHLPLGCAALERVLASDPARVDARLVYASLLFKLDRLDEAEEELQTLDVPGLDSRLREAARRLRREVGRARRRLLLRGRLGAGFDHSTNANYGPSSGQNLFLDVPINLTDESLPRSDQAAVLRADIEARRFFGPASKSSLFAAFSYYRAEQSRVKTFNLQDYSLQAGGALATRIGEITAGGLLDHLRLAQETFLRERGAKLSLGRRLGPSWAVRTEAQGVYEDFSSITQSPTAVEMRGPRYDFSLGVSFLPGPSMSLDAQATHSLKYAASRFNAYTRDSIGLSHSWNPAWEMVLQSYAQLDWDRYAERDPFVSATPREDWIWRAGLVWGTPLTFVSVCLKDLAWNVRYDYQQSVSNIMNYSFRENRIGTMLNYRWEL